MGNGNRPWTSIMSWMNLCKFNLRNNWFRFSICFLLDWISVFPVETWVGWNLNIDKEIGIERRREMTKGCLFISISKRRTNYVLRTGSAIWIFHHIIAFRHKTLSGPNNVPGTLTCSYSTYARTTHAVILLCRYVLCQGRSMIELWGRGAV